MTWTKTKPDVPGYYWFRPSPQNDAEIVWVGLYNVPFPSGPETLCAWDYNGESPGPIAGIDGEWAGPIPEATT